MYHHTRPDVILGLLTSQTVKATQPTDYTLQDWSQSGLRTSSAFRVFLTTLPASSVTLVGHLSQRDWQGVQSCLKKIFSGELESISISDTLSSPPPPQKRQVKNKAKKKKLSENSPLALIA